MQKIDTGDIYAMKKLRKDHIRDKGKRDHSKLELEVLTRIRNPFIVKAHFAFQNKFYLYLIMDFVNGGDLYVHLMRFF